MTSADRTLAARWRDRAAELRAHAAEGAARAYEKAAAELEAACDAVEAEALTLDEAAAASGYSADHLRKEVAAGRIPNAGRRHAPRIRRADLPRKPGYAPPSAAPLAVAAGYNVADDARALAGRMQQGVPGAAGLGRGAAPVREVA